MTATDTTLELGQSAVDVKEAADTDLRCWSVTTLIGVLDKPALLHWAAEQTAGAAVKQTEAWKAIEQSSGTDEAIKWLTGARFRGGRDELSATKFGTGVHKLCEEYALTGKRPDVDAKVFKADTDKATACLDRFDEWLAQFQPEYQATEVTVYSPTHGYAGTADNFVTIGGVPLIGDYKVAKEGNGKDGNPKPIYPETSLQLAGYAHAELAAVWRPRRFESFRRRYYLLSQAEQEHAVPVPKVQGGVGIKISPEHCIAYPVRCDEVVHEAFLFVIEAARWVLETSKGAIGDPLLPTVAS